MARIYISKLNPKLKQNILNRQYTLAEMEEIKGQMSQLMKTRKGGFHLALIMIVVCMAITIMLNTLHSGINAGFWIGLGISAAAIGVALAIIWFTGAGYTKYQYNRAIKQAYPEHVDMLKL